jgi:pimeloyl-ACP methyl ester carboxylesterase
MTTEAITIIAIHGNGGGAFRFSLVPELTAPAALHAITLPGFQGRPLPDGPIDLSTFTGAVRDAVQEVAAQRPGGSIVLLGHGIGGSIALDVVANDPEAVDGLILLSPVGVKLDERWFPKVMSQPFVRSAAKAVISSTLIQQTAGRLLFKGAPRSFAKRFLAEYGNADAFEVMFDLLNADWFDALPGTSVPVALVWGAKDRVLDVSHVEAYEAVIADTRRVVREDWGHYPMIEQPEDFATTIRDVAVGLVA